MRYPPEQKTRTRDRIVRNAARKLRVEGLTGPSVASIMKASGCSVASARSRIPEFQIAVARVAVEFTDSALSLHFQEACETDGQPEEYAVIEEYWFFKVRA